MSRYGTPRAVGDIVYAPYSPQRVGKVVAITKPASDCYEQRLTVRWKDGDVWANRRGADVLRLDDLIEDHEKKLQGHRDRRAAALVGIPDGAP